MSCRQTGFAMLAASNVQEVMDMGAVAHLATIKSRVPFLHFFDGFRTSHETQKIATLDYDDLYKIADHQAILEFRQRALNPEHPVLRGTAQNPDIFFQAKEAANKFYTATPAIVEGYMKEINKLTGRNYQLFNYYGHPQAERIIIAMGSACDAIEETVDYLNAQGEKVGLVVVHLYRPFSAEHLLKAIPQSVKKIAVLDRTKEPGSLGEPLYQDVLTAFFESNRGDVPNVVCGRYGLGSKDVTPAQIIAVYENLKAYMPKNHFTVGIEDDVTNLSLPVGKEIDITPEDTTSCKFWGIGGDGTVGANKNSITIIGDYTDMYTQAYFGYDSKKSMGITANYLRFGKEPIRSTYLIKTADFVACHVPSYLQRYEMIHELKDGGTFLLNAPWSVEELETQIPTNVKRQIAQKKIDFYMIDATKIAVELGLGKRTNTVLQAAFFKLANIIPIDDAVKYMKDMADKSYARRGEDILKMNYAAIDRGLTDFIKVNVPAAWANLPEDTTNPYDEVLTWSDKVDADFMRNVVLPINSLKGDFLPVSSFAGREDGTFPQGTASYEKRGIAIDVPKWIPENCIACNQCSYVCPHATIRPFLLNADEKAKCKFETIKPKMSALADYEYRIQVSSIDCPGCGNCAQVCPAKEKALVMEPLEKHLGEMENWYDCLKLSVKENPTNPETVLGSQFEFPYLEFSGACIGCGETPYAKLVTQLYGDRMYIANATGCSSIWAGSAPSTPFTTNHKGHGPAWANSLFEDTAEFGLGFQLAVVHRRDKMKDVLAQIAECDDACNELKAAAKEWIEKKECTKGSVEASERLRKVIGKCPTCDCEKLVKHVRENDDILVKKSVWCFGGDGWAYDIGYGGLDHVLAMGENVNMLVFDTEVYSNTGGQSSKATPTAAIAKFAASGKRSRKKDLGLMAISYGNVYVAQIGMGANQAQTLKAIVEAEAYDGPSVVIAYAPCIAHGIDMGATQLKTKQAVDAGYWHLYRYNPMLEQEGKNPFILDSKKPEADFMAFLESEDRYRSLKVSFPEVAQKLFEAAKEDADRRYDAYRRLAEQQY
jgi:pyruvate-ferredoxin/flavodoxin oxidoreductase